jgi:PAS domain-containing protein
MAMPVWIAGTRGELLYYNEPAEALLGKRFDEAGQMRLRDLPKIFETTAPDGSTIADRDLPLGIALREQKPAHLRVQITALDGTSRLLDITAVPLVVQGGHYLGAMAMFWEPDE